jgi:hypothetical protein
VVAVVVMDVGKEAVVLLAEAVVYPVPEVDTEN